VLHVINGEHYSGAERVQDLLAESLPEFGYQVGFACVKPGRFPGARRAKGAPLYDTGMRHRFDRRPARQLRRIVEGEDYQLLHAHTPRSLVIARQVSAKTGIPLVYHVHSPVGRDTMRGWKNRINRWIETRSLRGVARMICVSQSIGRYMESLGHQREKIAVVPNGVPPSSLQKTRGASSDRWTIGTVALFRPRKGIEVLLDAMAILKQRRFEPRLLAVGPFETTEYESEVRQRAATLAIEDAITWTGYCSEVNAHLLDMDLFVLPSLCGEGLPMVVLEAMAVGLPVIASRVEGTPEAVRDGIDGLMTEPGSAADLADKLASVIEGKVDWKTLSRSARQRQREYFSDRSMARGVASVYDQILANRRAGC
jgi:glycosyltransferase involved in cell wall biosynthesis